MCKSWLPEEEQMLDRLVKQGEPCWVKITALLNSQFPNRTRTSKQCRERYNDYISFKGKTMKKKDWGPEEERVFWEYIQVYGLSWTNISRALVQKKAKIIGSSNNLKNKFYASLKSLMHRINAAIGFKAAKSNIKWTPFKRFVCLNFYTKANESGNIENYQLCREIIQRAILKRLNMEKPFLKRVSQEVYKFCKLNRHLNARKLVVFKRVKKPVPQFQPSKAEVDVDNEIKAKIEEIYEVDPQNGVLNNFIGSSIKIQEKYQRHPELYFYPVMVPYPVFVPMNDMHFDKEQLSEIFLKNEQEQYLKEMAQEENIKKEEIQKRRKVNKKDEVEDSEGVVARPKRSMRSVFESRRRQKN